MTQKTTDKGFIKETIELIKDNSKTFLGVGLTLIGLRFAFKYLSKRVHPDFKKIFELRSTIQKSYSNALQALQTLNIEKRILTEYSEDSQNAGSESKQLNMQFLVISRLKLKQKNKSKELRNPFLPPFQEGLFITELEPTHRLLYNKFNIFKNHLLVVTKEFQAQNNQLNQTDFKQSIPVMKALNGFIFYNSTAEAGSSQPHKHVQVFPNQALQLPIMQKVIEFAKQRSADYDFEKQPIIQFPCFNFIHGMVLLNSEASLSQSRKQMHSAYKSLLQEVVYRIGAAGYNMIASQQFILLVSRSKSKAFDEISINAVGFMGSLLFKDQQKLNKYISLKIKPNRILEDITYPKNYVPKKVQSEGFSGAVQVPNQ